MKGWDTMAGADLTTLLDSPASLALGAGAGEGFVLADSVVREIKRDINSVPLNVAAKSGLVGLTAFLLPFVRALATSHRSGYQTAQAIGGSLVVSFVIGLTVPFWWTVGVMVAALILMAVTVIASRELLQASGVVQVGSPA